MIHSSFSRLEGRLSSLPFVETSHKNTLNDLIKLGKKELLNHNYRKLQYTLVRH